MDSHAVVEETLAKRFVPLLWRAEGNAVLPVLERLPDGSLLSELVAAADKHHREGVLGVRVVEYTIDDGGRPGASGTTYRLLTNVLDPADAPADELAALRPTLGDQVDLSWSATGIDEGDPRPC